MNDISDILATAVRHLHSDESSDAERLCSELLATNPNVGPAWEIRGLIAYQNGQQQLAETHFRRAIELQPSQATAHYNLGNSLRLQGKFEEAAESYHQALKLAPQLAEAWNNLALSLHCLDHLTDAEAHYRQAIQIRPQFAAAYSGLGSLFHQQNCFEKAETCYRRALELAPNSLDAINNLGHLLNTQQKFKEAEALLRSAIEFAPHSAAAHNNLGNTLKGLGSLSAASVCYRRALKLAPNYVEALGNLGGVLQEQGNVDGAIEYYRAAATHLGIGVFKDRAVAAAPEPHLLPAADRHRAADVMNNLATALKDRGQIDDAIVFYRQAISLKPDSAVPYSDLLYALYFSPSYDAAAILNEHRQFDRQYAAPLTKHVEHHTNLREQNRRLRIGYVSPDYRQHCQSLFTMPLFANHDHEHFEIYCYSDLARPDAITERLRKHADVWRDISGLTDKEAADRVRQDQIDILVDLTMHMGSGRPLLFARKPAPVQVCWLAYPGTTGLSAMDYRLTDPYLDPPALSDQFYSERSIQLADSFWCYQPMVEEFAVGPLPALENGFVTFGCLNNFCKVNDTVLSLWADVLQAVERSRLMLLAPSGTCRERTFKFLAQKGVASERIVFVDRRPIQDYLRLYQQIDVCLDTIPANGHTTTLDSLWMGVPVVTLVGQTAIGRGAYSQLMNLSLAELISQTPADYVRIAGELAMDVTRLSQLRWSLRNRMESSPLMDGPRFAHSMEHALREMWRNYCEAPSGY